MKEVYLWESSKSRVGKLKYPNAETDSGLYAIPNNGVYPCAASCFFIFFLFSFFLFSFLLFLAFGALFSFFITTRPPFFFEERSKRRNKKKTKTGAKKRRNKKMYMFLK